MRTWALRLMVVMLLAGALGPLATAPAQAAGDVTFTVTVASAYLRAQPSPSAERTYSVFQGTTYAITGRNADGTWVSLDFAAATAGTWIRASYGTVSGSLDALPVTQVSAPAVNTISPGTQSPGVPVTTGVVVGPTTGAASLTGIPGKTENFTITARSVFAMDAPSRDANRFASLFAGQTYVAVERDPNAAWLQIHLYGETLVWVPANVGTLDGNILDLPQPGVILPAQPTEPGYGPAPNQPLPAWIPTITAHMRSIYATAAQHGRDPRIVTVAGDCNSLSYYYMAVAPTGKFDLQGNDYLNNTIQEYWSSFFRTSIAVAGGFSAASVLDPTWADPQVCQAGESPFACELGNSHASIVFIMLGTGDQFDWQSFDQNYRKMIEFALSQGVLPVLVTKADALETEEGGAPENYINDDIRSLAQQYDVPLMDFNKATADLPNHGLLEEPGYDFHLSGAGMGVHLLATLETLDVLWRSLAGG